MAEQNRMVTGLFRGRDSAEHAYQALEGRGYRSDDLNVLMTDETRKEVLRRWQHPQERAGTKALEGAGVGAGVGAVTGGVIAAVVAAATIAVPGVGLVVAGPLAGAGAGSVAGGAIGALVGAGIPEERTQHYETGLSEGGIVLGVTPRSDDGWSRAAYRPLVSSCQSPRARTAGSSLKWKRQAGAPDALRCSIHCQGGAAKQSPGSQARTVSPMRLSPRPSMTWNTALAVRRSERVRSPGRSHCASQPMVGRGDAPVVGLTYRRLTGASGAVVSAIRARAARTLAQGQRTCG